MSARLPVLSGTKLIKILVQKGFIIRRQSGSHVVMQKDERVFAVPLHDSAEERNIESYSKVGWAECRRFEINLEYKMYQQLMR